MSQKPFPTWILIGFGAVALAVLVPLGIIFLVVEHNRSSWPTVEGVVVSVEEKYEDMDDAESRTDRDLLYRPTVEYVVDGKTYTVRSSYSRGEPWRVGDTATIRYDPQDPAKGDLNSEGWVGWLLLGMGVFLGLAFGVPGMLIRRSQRRVIPTT